MLDFSQCQLENIINDRGNHPGQSHAMLLKRSLALFQHAHGNGRFYRLLRRIQNKPVQLINLETLPESPSDNRHYGGIQPVPICQVQGTLGRDQDFDTHFHPLRERMRDRWVSIAIARLMHIPLEPVKLIQRGEQYFVVDGHHRISVARTLRESFIDAEVTIWKTAEEVVNIPEPANRSGLVRSLI
jgi:hypothetical protein